MDHRKTRLSGYGRWLYYYARGAGFLDRLTPLQRTIIEGRYRNESRPSLAKGLGRSAESINYHERCALSALNEWVVADLNSLNSASLLIVAGDLTVA